MEGFKSAVVLVLAFTCIAAKPLWNHLIPDGKEIIYEYEALVKAGTPIPHQFSSHFDLKGKLHIQLGGPNELLVRLDNLQYILDNGRDDERRESKRVTSELTDITKPFKIIFEDNGKIKEIVTEEGEPDFSVNMKKALSDMLQIDSEKVKLDTERPYAFTKKEKTIHGLGETFYNVMLRKDLLQIVRMHQMHSTEHMYSNKISDVTPIQCEAAFEEPITHDSQKIYQISHKTPGQYVLNRMESNGGVYYQPYQAKSTAFFVYINQTFKMPEIIDKQAPMTIQKEHRLDTLRILVSELTIPFEKVPDRKVLVPTVETMLHDMNEFLKQDKIKAERPDIKNGVLVTRILKVLSHFDMPMLEELHNKLIRKNTEDDKLILNMFRQLLPMIGMPESMKFIQKLVKENKLDEREAVDLLQKMPFYMRIRKESVLRDLEELEYMKNFPDTVRRVALLTFASLLRNVDDFNRQQEIKSSGLFENRINDFVEKIKTSQKMEDKFMYLDALYNMNNDLVINALEPLVRGEMFKDNRLRFKAMMALSSVITKPKHERKMNELLWPILTDRNLPTYMRIMSFHIMMKSKPSLSTQINIYSFMVHERDPDFLSFYESYLNSLTESKNPCLYRSKLQAKQLLKYWPISYVHSLTQYRKIDMTNRKFNFGQSHDIAFINTKEALIFMWKMNVNVMNLEANQNVVYIKVTGLDKKLLDGLQINTQKGMKFMEFQTLVDRFMILRDKEDLQVEVIQMHNGYIVENAFFDKNTIQSLPTYFKIMYLNQFTENKRTLDIHYDKMIRMLIPTDIGFPVLFELFQPSVHDTQVKLFKEETGNNIININIDNKYRVWDYSSYGLSFHNPFASVWQGVKKYMTWDSTLPIFLTLSINPQQNTLKISDKRHQDRNEDVTGYRSYSTSYVFVNDYLEKNVLKASTPTAEQFVRVAHPDNYLRNVTLVDSEEYNIGSRYQLKIFDDENPKYYQKFPLLMDWFMGSAESWTEQFMNFLMYRTYIRMQHDVVERGVMSRLEPSTQNPVTSLDLTMRLNHEIVESGISLLQPAMKIKARATYAIKKEDKALKTWDINAAWDLNNGHTVNSLKLDITRSIPGQNDYKICAQGTEKYSETDITGHMTVTMGQSTDGKCSKDETVVQLTMKGEQLPEQKQRLNNFESCHKPTMALIRDLRPYSCYVNRFSIRQYVIDVKATNFPTEFRKAIDKMLTSSLGRYEENYVHFDVTTPDIKENNMRIELRFPVSKDIVDMRFIRPTQIDKFKGIPAKELESIGIYPDNLKLGHLNWLLHEWGLTSLCTIHKQDLININRELLSNIVTNDWTMVAAEKLENSEHSLLVKLVNDKLAMKIVHTSHTLLITPSEDKFTITLDGKDLGDISNFNAELFSLTKMEDTNTGVYFSKYSGFQIIHNGDELLIEMPKTDKNLIGKCFTRFQ